VPSEDELADAYRLFAHGRGRADHRTRAGQTQWRLRSADPHRPARAVTQYLADTRRVMG
jgi:hypothetical protein